MRLTVDGTPVTVTAGASLLDAAYLAGAFVPSLCSDPRLRPAGSCRLCLVAVDEHGPVPACTTPAADGVAVRTDDPAVRATVRAVLGLLVSSLPPDAFALPTQLRAVCDRLGVGPEAFGEPAGRGRDETHPYVHLDRDLCIACGRCVRMCAEVQGTFALTLAGRDADTVVAAGAGGAWLDSPCVACGGCVDTCPTGALHEAEQANLRMADATTLTTCGYCGVGCTLRVHTQGNEIAWVSPAPGGAVNRGHACVKGRFAHAFVRAPDRLTTPLMRRHGRLEPASWEEALAHVADGLSAVRAMYGPDAVAMLSSARTTNEENYLAQKLMRVAIGSNNVDNCSRVCHAPSAAALTAAFGYAGGTNSLDDFDAADCFLVAGSNTTEAHPVVGARIRQRVLQGASLVVVDPRRTELAALADVHLSVRPGGNVAVFHGLARLLLEGGYADEAFLRERAEGLDALQARLDEFPPDRVEQLSGVEIDLLRKAARLYGSASCPAIVYGLGVTEHAHGTDGVRALANLAILRGAVGTDRGAGVTPLRGQNNVQGASDMGALPDRLPGYQAVADPRVRARFAAAWGAPVPDRAGLRLPEMLAGAGEGQIRALWLIGEDVLQTNPASERVRAALAACDLVVCHEVFPTATAAAADVVLPVATFLEKDGTFTNFDRRFQRVRPAVAPPRHVRDDFSLLQDVARGLGADLGCATPAAALDECAAVAPLFAGVSHRRLEAEGFLSWPCRSADDPGEPVLYRRRFATRSGRAVLGDVQWLSPGEVPDVDYPFVLVTGRRLVHYNSGSMTRRTPNRRLLDRETVDVHPQDAARLGLADTDPVRVVSRRAETVLSARVTDEVRPGQLFCAFHFPEARTNALTSEQADAHTGCPEYKVTAVRLAPAGATGLEPLADAAPG